MNFLTETLGENTYAFLYILTLAFLVYLFVLLLTFILNPWDHRPFFGKRPKLR